MDLTSLGLTGKCNVFVNVQKANMLLRKKQHYTLYFNFCNAVPQGSYPVSFARNVAEQIKFWKFWPSILEVCVSFVYNYIWLFCIHNIMNIA